MEKRHHLLHSVKYCVGDTITIKESKSGQLTGQGVVKKILYVTHGDNDILKKGYSIVQW